MIKKVIITDMNEIVILNWEKITELPTLIHF